MAIHRLYSGQTLYSQQYLIFNEETETWEPVTKGRWFECGQVLDNIPNAVCTKYIGHEGEHGQRDD